MVDCESTSCILTSDELHFVFYQLAKREQDKYVTFDRCHPDRPFLTTHPKSEQEPRQFHHWTSLGLALADVRRLGNTARLEAVDKLQAEWEAGSRDPRCELKHGKQKERYFRKLMAHYDSQYQQEDSQPTIQPQQQPQQDQQQDHRLEADTRRTKRARVGPSQHVSARRQT